MSSRYMTAGEYAAGPMTGLPKDNGLARGDRVVCIHTLHKATVGERGTVRSVKGAYATVFWDMEGRYTKVSQISSFALQKLEVLDRLAEL